jgi:hypothetical protein
VLGGDKGQINTLFCENTVQYLLDI